MVSHLLFADDMLVFCKGYEKLAKGVNDASQKLEQYTGLAINKQKSKVFLSKGCKVKDEIAAILGVPIGCLPLKYLGLPLTISYPKARHFLHLLTR